MQIETDVTEHKVARKSLPRVRLRLPDSSGRHKPE